MGKLRSMAKRATCAPLSGKSTLNRLELSRPEPTRYHKVSHDPQAIETLFVTLFVEAHKKAPKQVIHRGRDHPGIRERNHLGTKGRLHRNRQ